MRWWVVIGCVCLPTLADGSPVVQALAPAIGAPMPPPPPEATLPPPPALTDTQAAVEAKLLRSALRSEVPQAVTISSRRRAVMIELARDAMGRSGRVIDRPQLPVVVDRNPSVQLLLLIMAVPDAPWQAIGGRRVSTGQRGRRFYYITPTGVFENTDAILGYRAQGTFNEHHIRGDGLKGMRVWDFGWHGAEKGSLQHETGQIRLEWHATDPHFLEARIGPGLRGVHTDHGGDEPVSRPAWRA